MPFTKVTAAPVSLPPAQLVQSPPTMVVWGKVSSAGWGVPLTVRLRRAAENGAL